MKKDYIYIGIIALLLVLYFFKPTHKNEELKNKIEEQQRDIRAKEIVIRQLDSTLTIYATERAKTVDKYNNNKKEYVKITKEKAHRDSVINTLSIDAIQQAIISRYNNNNN